MHVEFASQLSPNNTFVAIGNATLEYWVLAKKVDETYGPDGKLEKLIVEKVSSLRMPDPGEQERLRELGVGLPDIKVIYK